MFSLCPSTRGREYPNFWSKVLSGGRGYHSLLPQVLGGGEGTPSPVTGPVQSPVPGPGYLSQDMTGQTGQGVPQTGQGTPFPNRTGIPLPRTGERVMLRNGDANANVENGCPPIIIPMPANYLFSAFAFTSPWAFGR